MHPSEFQVGLMGHVGCFERDPDGVVVDDGASNPGARGDDLDGFRVEEHWVAE